MLNSRYAPIVALAVLGIIIVGVLGWFLAIKPQLDQKSDLESQTATIRGNIEQVEAASAKLDEYAALLDADDTTAASIELNAPSRLDVAAFRSRVSDALRDSRIELISFEQGTANMVEGWETDASLLVSNQVAGLFSQGPVAAAENAQEPSTAPSPDAAEPGEATAPAAAGWTPVVTPSTASEAVAGDIRMVPFSMELAGSPAEAYDFLRILADPEQQLFQVYEVTQVSRPADSGTLPGVADARDGDAQTTVRGAVYVLDPDLSIIDEPRGEDATPPGDSAFRKPPSSPAQPGA